MEALLRQALARAEEVGQALADPATAKDPAKLQSLGREHNRLVPIVRSAERLRNLQQQLQDARDLALEADPELSSLAKGEVATLQPEVTALEAELVEMLVPRDPHDDRDAILEIRAGTGGDEASLFAGELVRMYTRFAERHGFKQIGRAHV